MKNRRILLIILCLSFALVLVPQLAKAKPAQAGDTIPPSVSITSPPSGTEVSVNQNVTIQAVASDNRKVTKVEFYDNGVLKGTDTRKPFSYVWKADIIGTHDWTAKAYDSSGNSSVSSVVTLTVDIGAVDTAPDQFTFIDQTGVALSTVVTSNTITVSGINAASPISITGGTYSVKIGRAHV